MGYINSEDFKMLKREYKAGKRVKAIQVDNIKPGTLGTVKAVRSNGSIIVLWDIGYETNVIYGEESLGSVVEGTCLLGYVPDGEECGGGFCSTCGWNSEIAAKRLKKVHGGGMVKDKAGVRKLKIKRWRGV